MKDLLNTKCSACNRSSTALSTNEIKTLLLQLPHWQLVEEKNEEKVIQKLTCTYHAKSYSHALALTNAIAELAETENHHPDILLCYSEVIVSWWTHVVNGLHNNDFIMAAKTADIVNKISSSN